jgi:hypothetical protein
MVEAGENLAFMPQPVQHFCGVHAGLHQLERGLLLEVSVVSER